MHLPLRSVARYLFATCSIMTVAAFPVSISSSAAAAAVTGEFAFTGSVTGSMTAKAGACLDGRALIGFDSQLTGHVRFPVGPAPGSGYSGSSVSLVISSATLAPRTTKTAALTWMTTNTTEKSQVTLDIYVGSVDENYVWSSANGSIANNGGSGSINMGMVPGTDLGGNGTIPGPGDVHIRGSWNC